MTFKKALKKMLEDGEFPKIIANSKGKDKREAKKFYKIIKDVDLDKCAMIPMIMGLNSVSVFRDAVFYMMKDSDCENIQNKDK